MGELVKLIISEVMMGHKIKQSLVNSRVEFFYYAFRNILLVSVPLLIVSSVVLSHLSFHSSAYSSSTDSVSLSLPTSCTISANVLTPHNATLVNGQYEGNIGNTRINAYCNDNNGYFIYAIGSSNDTDGNTDLVSSINDNYNIHTNIYDGGTITANTPSSWAMKLTSSNGTYAPTIIDEYSNYNLIPSTDTIVAYRLSGTSMDLDTDLTGSYFNTTYEIYTNPIQPAGTYLGKVKYTMTHPYDASQLTTMEEAFDIAGKDKVQVTDPITGETGNYYKMQDMSSRICSLTTAYETEEKLVDIRDNKLYYVSKLEDGHCWMTQNLDLDLNSYTNEQGQEVMEPLTSNDTDLTNHLLIGAYLDGYSYDSNTGITTWIPAISAKTMNFSSTSVSGWQDSNTTPYTANKTDDINTGHASLGNYYNMATAVASNNTSAATGGDPTNSICPKGWHLPTNGDFRALNNLYNYNSTNSDTGLISQPLYFRYSGYINNKKLNSINSGYYISGIIRLNGTYTLNLFFSSNTVSTGDAELWGSSGIPVRCLSR